MKTPTTLKKRIASAIERLHFKLYQWLFFDLATGSFVFGSLFFGAGLALVLAFWEAHQ